MQVATLFRETATLLGASMEAQDTPGSDSHSLKYRSSFSDGVMKQETRDDGYETSADLELRSHGESHRLINHMQVTGMSMKCEPPDDPYSFVDDDPLPLVQPRSQSMILPNTPKKRGRKKKIFSESVNSTENMMNGQLLMKKKLKDSKFNPGFKERKKHDRFNGMPEEEVSKRTLPDHLALNLDIVIIGINPGLFAAYKGHHYAGPGNHFWKCLYLSGLTPEPMTADDDYKLLQVGIGFTNMVARPTKGSADLTRKEIKEGSQVLLEKLQKFKPKIAVFNGKLIFEVFSGKKDFSFGRQPEFVDGTNTYMWVMPSSSARCAQLPRAADKVPFYAALKKFRDYLNGIISDLDESEVVFTDSKLKNYFEPEIKDEPKEEHSFYGYGRLPSNSELTDLSNAVVKKDDQNQLPVVKKKRGRPKKIKSDCPEVKKVGNDIPKKDLDNSDVPKKKRGRPKKIKADDVMMSPSQFPDHKNTPPQISTCFSPPIHSPGSFGQPVSTYSNQNLSQSFTQNQSPSEPHNYHQSPLHSQHYSQSPQASSQAFTHSDLSSEISAAISSEHNLGSPSPTSPSIGPPDFEPPASMPEDASDEQHSARSMKEDVSPNSMQKQNECQFSSPAPSNEGTTLGYHTYRGYQHDPEPNHSIIGYGTGSPAEYNSKRNLNQDMSSKSLSGLESLVDQIPSIAEGDTTHNCVGNSEEHYESSHVSTRQYHDESAYLGIYANSSHYANGSNASNSGSYSPQFPSAGANYASPTSNSYSLHHSNPSMNFSVTSLANSSASMNHDICNDVPNSFSVSNLATSNYPSINSNVNSYSNLIGAHHTMGSHMMGGSNGISGGMFGGGMSGGIVERACSMGSLSSSVGIPNHMSGMNMTGSAIPYPYRQYSHSTSSYSSGHGGGFSYSPAHGIHMPSPNYPYPSPYSNSTYPQPSYLPNHVLDRIKQDRMDIGFGGF